MPDPVEPPPSPAAEAVPADVVPLEATTPLPPPRPSYGLWHLVSVLTGLLLGASLLLLAHKYFAARIFPAPVVANNF